MKARENLIRAIKREDPAYVPWTVPYPEYQYLAEGVRKRMGIKGNVAVVGQESVDNWGTRWVPIGYKYMYPHAKEYLLANLEDLDDYVFPNPNEIELEDGSKELLQTVDREEILVFGSHDQMLYERAIWLCGMENFAVALYTNRKRVERLISDIADYQVALARYYIKLGSMGTGVRRISATKGS